MGDNTATAKIEEMRANLEELTEMIGFSDHIAQINDALDYLAESAKG